MINNKKTYKLLMTINIVILISISILFLISLKAISGLTLSTTENFAYYWMPILITFIICLAFFSWDYFLTQKKISKYITILILIFFSCTIIFIPIAIIWYKNIVENLCFEINKNYINSSRLVLIVSFILNIAVFLIVYNLTFGAATFLFILFNIPAMFFLYKLIIKLHKIVRI